MTVQQIRALGPALSTFLDEFTGSFLNFDTCYHLKEYISGQLSDLPRKSVEPIAHLMDVPPRTLQEFLSLSEWDEDGLRDTQQKIVARDHAEDQAIGIVDESGHPKKGIKTATVHRDYCGASGKVDNCVISVHLCYTSFDGQFRTMIDSDLYLPKDGWNDPDRRREAEIPDSVVYRPKYVIAEEQLKRALSNGLHLGWVTADEWYGGKPPFLESLDVMGLRFVLEIPRNLMGWVREPASADTPRGQVQNMARWSHPLLYQDWVKFHIKDTGMGPMVWEAKATPFWMKRGDEVVGPYWLVVARNCLNPEEIKYFLSNASAGVPLEVILHVGFSRWPVERCLEDEKSELGLSHFEVRKYPAIVRHLRITQVSHLFLARQTRRLREKKSRGDDLPSPRCGQRAAGCLAAGRRGSEAAPGESRSHPPRDPETERQGPGFSRQGARAAASRAGHPPGEAQVLHAAAEWIAL
ncbi:MAG: IS701 family transposase [Thiobacillaceae bacterium]